MSLISIIIPYYNRPVKLSRCIKSVLDQTYQNFEVLVVDDCSSVPLTFDIDPRIKVFRNDSNIGPGLSRNVGLENAKGEYLAFLDCDDYWHKDFLQIIIESLWKHPYAVMAYAEGLIVDSDGSVIDRRKKRNTHNIEILPYVLYRGKVWGTGGCLWRQVMVQNIRWVSSRNWEDYAYAIEVGIGNNSIIPIETPLIYYDSSGNDKLSKQDSSLKFREKNKSLCYVSDLLYNSIYKNDPFVKKYITLLLILNLIKLKKYNVKEHIYYRRIIKSIGLWRPKSFKLYVMLIASMNNKMAIWFLKHLKRGIDNYSLPFFMR